MDIEDLFRAERGRILATLIRWAGDFDVAEDAMHDAFSVALEKWPTDGAPANPVAWIIGTARHKAIDRVRRQRSFEAKREEIERELLSEDDEPVPEDQLRLLFTCCHPALAVEAQVALTLRTLGGLTTEEIARAFLVPAPTMAQRLVRAKGKIRGAAIPYRVPDDEALGERLAAVMAVVYLVFNEGYSASFGDRLVRGELCARAIVLARLLAELLPDEPEPKGLLALMLLTDARRDTRVDGAGDIVRLEYQDRSRWDRAEIEEGLSLVQASAGPYSLQAAIAAVHARASSAETTDWAQIAALYSVLARLHPSPVIELNHAVAVAMTGALDRALAAIEALDRRGDLTGYHLLPAARAEVLRRLSRSEEAAEAYRRALALVSNDAERRHLEKRLVETEASLAAQRPVSSPVGAGGRSS